MLKTIKRVIDRFQRKETMIRDPPQESQYTYLGENATETALHPPVTKIYVACISRNSMSWLSSWIFKGHLI